MWECNMENIQIYGGKSGGLGEGMYCNKQIDKVCEIANFSINPV